MWLSRMSRFGPFVSQWMQHLPQNIHLVIASRTRPGWTFLSRWKVRGDILEITEKDLSFSPEEIQVLFSDLYECPLSEDRVEAIYRLTEGWVIALNMIWQHIRDEEAWKSLETAGSLEAMDDLFSFLAADVFYKQPE